MVAGYVASGVASGVRAECASIHPRFGYNARDSYRIEEVSMAEPTYEELKARLAEMEKKSSGRRTGQLDFRVGEKGGVSVYGLGRFPVTLYYEQWIRLLDAAAELRAFLEENKAEGKLKLKEK
jgi:hypothetical protein